MSAGISKASRLLTNVRINTDNTLGAAIGKVTRRKTCHSLLPDTTAASSRDGSMERKGVPMSKNTTERASFQPLNVEQAFARADRNRDGFIDASEAGAVPGLLPLFAIADLNGDGRIDRTELARIRLPRERPGETRA